MDLQQAKALLLKSSKQEPSPTRDGSAFRHTELPTPSIHHDFTIVDPHTGETFNISQSMVKAYLDVACEMQFYKTSVTRELEREQTQAQAEGWRFEYLVAGATDRKGNVPEPIRTPTGKLSSVNARLSANAEAARAALIAEGFDLDNAVVGHRITTATGLQGDLDMLTKRHGKLCIVDLKYSGLLGNPYEMLGWNWTDEYRPNYLYKNPKHTTQALHYQLLHRIHYYGVEVPFYFAVFDSRAGHEGEYRIFEMQALDSARARHLRLLLSTQQAVQAMLNDGVTYSPSFDRCRRCPYLDCPKRATAPEVITGVVE